MAPRKKNAAIKSSGATSSKASPLPDWVKKGGKPPPKEVVATSSSASKGEKANATAGTNGNAATANGTASAAAGPSRPPPLFPPGTKTPMNLLNERIQKIHKEWNRPEYHPKPYRGDRSVPGGGQDGDNRGEDRGKDKEEWTCSVTLTRTNPKDRSATDIVKLIPDDKDERQRFAAGVDSKEMARHWGATYALFRLFSTLSLGLMLPHQFKTYWSSLEAWKKSLSPEQQAYLFAADPFFVQEQSRTAKKEKEEKAALAAQKSQDGRPGGQDVSKLPKRWREAREVRMAKRMRDWVEEVVKKANSELVMDQDLDIAGDGQGSAPASQAASRAASPSGTSNTQTSRIDTKQLEKTLAQLGFRAGYISSSLSWLSRARTALASTTRPKDSLVLSIEGQKDLDALLTYLTLYVPEEDLPDRFKASKQSTNEGFVTSSLKGASGEDGLKIQWAIDRLVKVAGFPRAAVESAFKAIAGQEPATREIGVLKMLLQQLQPSPSGGDDGVLSSSPSEELMEQRRDEVLVLKSILGENRIVPIPPDERPLSFSADSDDCFDIIVAGPSRQRIDKTGQWGKEEIRLRILWKLDDYPAVDGGTAPTFYVASSAVGTQSPLPSYLRLALTQHLLKTMRTADWARDPQLLLPLVEELESSYKHIVNGDSVRFEEVMKGFASPPRSKADTNGSGASTPLGPRVDKCKDGKGNFRAPRPLTRQPDIDKSLSAAQRELRGSANGQKLLSQRASLPISRHVEGIVAALASHRLTLLTGSTGSGKTTQLPQFILDSAIEAGSGSLCKIIVTQPRRVSAMSIAERVAFERGESLGDTVGWAVRGERKVGRANRILFTTTGLLLRRMQNEPDLASISHLLIDEIHERSLDSDLLLLEISTLLKLNPRIKVVLMSATLQKEKFVDYFAARIEAGREGIGSVDVEGRIHPVQDHYLEDLVAGIGFKSSQGLRDRGAGPLQGLRGDLASRGFSEGDITTMEILERERSGTAVGPLDYDLVGKAVRFVADLEAEKERSLADGHIGAILVFMSGVGEIRQAIEAIRSSMQGSAPVEVMPLHSNLSSQEQQAVFRPVRYGVRKIVVSTNVAEASVTIDGVTAVIDSGRVKETMFDPDSGLTRLIEQYTSRASAMQRRGRAGRTRAGTCWKLFSRTMERRKLPEESKPEMTRVPLESVILHVLSMNKSAVASYLSSALDPPLMASISSAIVNLEEAGAIRHVSAGRLAATALGRSLTNLPLDYRIGKMLILGCIFQCLNPLLTVAAMLSCKPLFAVPFEKRDEVASLRASKAVGKSDLLTDAAIYDEWASIRQRGAAAGGSVNSEMRNFATSHFLSVTSLRDITSTRLDLLSNLQEIGFVPRGYHASSTSATSQASSLDAYSQNTSLLRSILGAALWPAMIRISHPSAKFDQSSSGTVLRDTEAKQVKLFDDVAGQRVFLHPSSVLFNNNKFQSSHLVVFSKSSGGGGRGPKEKVYLRDATEVPTFALLLFCGKVGIHHLKGGLSCARVATTFPNTSSLTTTTTNNAEGTAPRTVDSDSSSDEDAEDHGRGQESTARDATQSTSMVAASKRAFEAEGLILLRSPARIGVLAAQLRRLLDRHLANIFEGQEEEEEEDDEEVVKLKEEGGEDDDDGVKEREVTREAVEVMRALLEGDGM